ncbi:hypothetical protein AYI68_g252 [Smittium mucronatum]|uniref:Uncharacterized protein n=1 Tax=Smittium mucronatum TaxID=133383 RepID=A0A1R0H8Y1_9FUNG|nr:hypothetical protein AYI68_g252 [Smittium mucronatum]
MLDGGRQLPKVMISLLGSEERLGLDLSVFGEDIDEAIETIFKKLVNSFKTKEITFKEKRIHFSDTLELKGDILNITIPTHDGKSLNKVLAAIKENILPAGTLIDITVLTLHGIKRYNGIKIVLKKNKDSSIPDFLIVENAIFSLIYKDATKVCNYCKLSNHTIDTCEKIKEKEKKRLEKIAKKSIFKTPFDNSTTANFTNFEFLDDSNQKKYKNPQEWKTTPKRKKTKPESE